MRTAHIPAAAAVRRAALVALAVTAFACDDDERAPADTGSGRAFSIVLIPDTQYYMGPGDDTFARQTAWVAERAEVDDIRLAIHLGDMTNRNTPAEWDKAREAMAALDGVVPYTPMPGNHDGIKGGVIASELYNEHFPASRFEDEPWYGGHYGDTNDSHYALLEAGGVKLMVVSLGFGTPDEQLAWADEVIGAHPDRQVIVATHAYLDDDGTKLDRGEEFAVEAERWNDGTHIWDRVIRDNPNVFLVVCGHVPEQGRATSDNAAGEPVHEILANYQGEPNGGNGYLRILRFRPDEDRIDVTAYSPVLDETRDGPAHSFSLDHEL